MPVDLDAARARWEASRSEALAWVAVLAPKALAAIKSVCERDERDYRAAVEAALHERLRGVELLSPKREQDERNCAGHGIAFGPALTRLTNEEEETLRALFDLTRGELLAQLRVSRLSEEALLMVKVLAHGPSADPRGPCPDVFKRDAHDLLARVQVVIEALHRETAPPVPTSEPTGEPAPQPQSASARERDPEGKATLLVTAWVSDPSLIGESNSKLAAATNLPSGTISRIIDNLAVEETTRGRIARQHRDAKTERAERSITPRAPTPDRRGRAARSRSRDGADRESLDGRP